MCQCHVSCVISYIAGYKDIVVLQPAPLSYDHSVDEREHTVEQWKQLIYQEVVEYAAPQQPPPLQPPPDLAQPALTT